MSGKVVPGSAAEKPRGASEIFGTVPFSLKRHVSPHGQVTAVSMMKDEGPFVLEWVAHHLAIGFTDLVVFTNDCSDGTDDILIRLEELGLAHHRRNVIPEGIRPQPSALNHAEQDAVVRGSDWVLVFDADEFVSIRYGNGTLDDLLDATVQTGANGIVITWRIFGAGGVVEWSRAPVTEQYLQAAPADWNKGWGVKTLFKYDPEYWKLGIHRPKIKQKHIKSGFPDQVKWINGSGREMPEYFKFRGWRSIVRTVGYDWVQLNHYAVKSVDSYALRKLRGNVNNKKDKYNSDYWALQDRNETRDATMLRYTERRNQLLAQLLTDPVLNKLHFAAIERVEARLAEIKATEAYATLVADLAKASAVPLDQIVAKPPQARDKDKIAALMSDVEKLRTGKARAERLADPATPEAERVPPTLYAGDQLPLTSLDGADWAANHSILLPLSSEVFAPSILPALGKGKFDRGMARRLPKVLPSGAVVLQLGADIGFLGLYLARARPDLRVILQEDDPGFAAARAAIYAQNQAEAPALPQVLIASLGGEVAGPQAIAALLAAHPAKALILSDPRISPEVLQTAFAASAFPELVFLHARLMSRRRSDMAAFDALFASLGYAPIAAFDPVVTRAFQLQAPAIAATKDPATL